MGHNTAETWLDNIQHGQESARKITQLSEALEQIATGSFPGASTLAVNGDWRGMVYEFQTIARHALGKEKLP